MKAAELRAMSHVELSQQLDHMRAELFNLRFQQAARQLRNPSRFRQVKRDIARILTLMREQEIRTGSETKQ
jgi:large subunit ribosomal protein L29